MTIEIAGKEFDRMVHFGTQIQENLKKHTTIPKTLSDKLSETLWSAIAVTCNGKRSDGEKVMFFKRQLLVIDASLEKVVLPENQLESFKITTLAFLKKVEEIFQKTFQLSFTPALEYAPVTKTLKKSSPEAQKLYHYGHTINEFITLSEIPSQTFTMTQLLKHTIESIVEFEQTKTAITANMQLFIQMGKEQLPKETFSHICILLKFIEEIFNKKIVAKHGPSVKPISFFTDTLPPKGASEPSVFSSSSSVTCQRTNSLLPSLPMEAALNE